MEFAGPDSRRKTGRVFIRRSVGKHNVIPRRRRRGATGKRVVGYHRRFGRDAGRVDGFAFGGLVNLPVVGVPSVNQQVLRESKLARADIATLRVVGEIAGRDVLSRGSAGVVILKVGPFRHNSAGRNAILPQNRNREPLNRNVLKRHRQRKGVVWSRKAADAGGLAHQGVASADAAGRHACNPPVGLGLHRKLQLRIRHRPQSHHAGALVRRLEFAGPDSRRKRSRGFVRRSVGKHNVIPRRRRRRSGKHFHPHIRIRGHFADALFGGRGRIESDEVLAKIGGGAFHQRNPGLRSGDAVVGQFQRHHRPGGEMDAGR